MGKILEDVGFEVQKETSQFVDPKVSYEAEKRSLMNHASKNTYVPEDSLCLEAAQILAEQCSVARALYPDDWDSDEKILAAVQDVDRDSNPGYPWIAGPYRGKKNGEIIDMLMEEGLLVKLVRAALNWDEQALTRLFEKWEPHKLKKVQLDMERLISSPGLIEQIRDRVLFGPLEASLRGAYPNIPVATGWADKKGVHHRLLRGFRKKIRCLALDKGTWDWTVTRLHLWILRHFCRLMVTFESLQAEARWMRGFDRWLELNFGPGHTFVTSDGQGFEQVFWGIWKSGLFMTLTGNAIMNSGLDIYAQLKIGRTKDQIKDCKMAAFGDDTLQEFPEDIDLDSYIAALRSTGAIIKEEDIVLGTGLEGLEFCGHEIKEVYLEESGRKAWGLFPVRKGKMLANLLRAKDDEVFDTLTSAKINWVNDPDTFEKLHRAQFSWCRMHPGAEGWVPRIKSYSECREIAHGYLLAE